MPEDLETPFDEFGTRLRAAAPRDIDTENALHALRPALQRARRRRQAATGVLSGLGLAAMVAIGTLAIGSGGSPDVRVPPAGRDRVPTVTTPDPLPTSVPGPTTSTTIDDDRDDDRAGGDGGGGDDDDDDEDRSGSSGSGS